MVSERKTPLFRPRQNRLVHAIREGRTLPGLPVLYGAAAIILGAVAPAALAANATPPLPTPCPGGSCGVHSGALSFVQSGALGNGGKPVVSGSTMTIQQTSDKAILNWQDFNVAKGSTVNFVLPSNTSATLNRIWSADPSRISGALNSYYGKADAKTGQMAVGGQIYLINQNGIVFGQGAQVDTGGLTASTLNVSDALFNNGLLSQNGASILAGGVLQPVFSDASWPGAAKGIEVLPGAQLTTADGGRIMLLGTTVSNQGTITTPDGQTILGAGKAVYLAATSDPGMRGLLIAVSGDELAVNSTVTNQGQITAARGNVTLAGFVVNQQGVINATTAISANGSISLIAGDVPTDGSSQFYDGGHIGVAQGQMLPTSGGTLTLAAGSVTQIQADATDTAVITDTQAFNPSQVNLVGKTVVLQGSSGGLAGAAITAPGATVDVKAAADPYVYAQKLAGSALPPAPDGGRIYLDSCSSIDVSGLNDVAISAARDVVQIRLGSNELADDPLQRGGFLAGQTVTVNLDQGSPLLNQATVLANLNNIGRGIQEKLTTAGKILLNSGGDVITRAGSVQNVSGGSISFQSDIAQATTKLIGADGKLYDIGAAPNNVQYVGIVDGSSYTDPKWGVTYTSTGGLAHYAAYLQGANAGSITLKAPQVYLRGSLLAQTVAGPKQRSAGTLPQGGTFVLGAASATLLPSGKNRDAPSIVLQDRVGDDLGSAFDPASSALPLDDQNSLTLSAGDLGRNGFNHIALYSNGSITLPAGFALNLAGNGSLSLDAQSIEIDGSIRTPGSAISMVTETGLAAAATVNNDIVLGDQASIDVSGNWTNDSPAVTAHIGTAPIFLNGGSISLQSLGNVALSDSSLLNVSGGAWINSANKLATGSGGSISLQANSGQGALGTPQFNHQVTLGTSGNATLLGASFGNGGSLAISSGSVTVGAPAQGTPGELVLDPGFFSRGGFANYNITGIENVTLGSGTAAVTIRPTQQNLVFTQNSLFQQTGTDLRSFTTLQTLPDRLRGAASVAFSATGTPSNQSGPGNLTLNKNTSIVVDPGGKVALSAHENLYVYGNITAPAGTIDLELAPGFSISTDADGYIAGQELLIGSSARLSATGFAAIYSDNNPYGYRQGQVLSGGSIKVFANKGAVVAQSGSVLDVSGASGTVDVPGGGSVTPTLVAGGAGSIDIEARENIVLNSSLLGKAAPVAGAAGGSLTIGLDLFNLADTNSVNSSGAAAYPVGDRNLTLTGATALSDSLPAQNGVGSVSTGSFSGGGFDNIAVKSSDIITLDGNLALNARSSVTLDALQLAATSGTTAHIGAAYVVLGNSHYYTAGQGEHDRAYTPTAGNATLKIDGDLIDIRGNSTLSGFDSADFNSAGDIRFSYGTDAASAATDFTGSLKTTANLDFTAAQLYPVTNAQFIINPADLDAAHPTLSASYSYAPGAVTINAVPGSAHAVPLSALGGLTIDGASIAQNGVLRAPFGQISLNGVGAQSNVTLSAGSLTSVSAEGQLIPYGSTLNGQQLTYQVDNNGSNSITQLLGAVPSKQVNLNGNQVSINSGAKVDLSGGGDLYSYEFIAGTGGSKDVLDPANGNYSYAILPSLGSQTAPLDHQYGIGSSIPAGEQVYLSGVPGLPNGFYTLLPARYALLPGAYAVQVAKTNSDLPPGAAIKQADGSYMVAGRYAIGGTDIIDSRTSTFVLTPGSTVRTQSQYNDTFANNFFNTTTSASTVLANLPVDAGQLQLGVTGGLLLDGVLNFTPGQFVSGKDAKGNPVMQQGRGGDVAIEAPHIEVVDQAGPADGSLQLAASTLDKLGAASLVLGAHRVRTSSGDQLAYQTNADGTPVDQSVVVQNSAANPLSAPDIILASPQLVKLADGSSIKASGTQSGAASILKVSGDGAVLRVSSGPQVSLVRSNVPAAPQGTLSIGSQATVSGSSLILDAAGDTQLAPDAAITAQAVDASSSRVSLGDVPAGTGGLNFTSQMLNSFNGLTDLTLHSDSTIDFYGAVQLGMLDAAGKPVLQSVTLDSRGIGGYGSGDKNIHAGSITLSDVGNAQSAPAFLQAPAGTGQLILSASPTATPTAQAASGQITLGAGDKDIRGFGGVQLSATADIRGQGSGTLNLSQAGDLSLQSARLGTDNGAAQTISTQGGVAIAAAGGTAAAQLPAAGVGGKLVISGSSIRQDGRIELPAGIVSLEANGAAGGDVTLGAGSTIDVAGIARPYFDTYAVAAGGSVSLGAAQGNVSIAQGASVDVSGATAADGKTSGNAGSLAVSAAQGQFNLAGTIKGAAASGKQQGSFTLDAGSLAGNFSALNTVLSAGGFQGAVSERIRSGDVAIAAQDTVKASSFALSADQGAISVAGTIDTSASSGSGGTIDLWSSGDLSLLQGGLLKSAAGAQAGNSPARGGDITLGSSAGTIRLAAGSTIDVQGTPSAAATVNPGVDNDGQLRLVALYNAGSINVQPIGSTIKSSQPATVIVDAVLRQADSSSFGSADLTVALQGFTDPAGIAAALTPTGAGFSVQVRPDVVVQSSGDLTVKNTLDLNAMQSGGVPVDLTLRAAGKLLFNGSLSDGFSNTGGTVSQWTLTGGDSGSYQLTAGADLAAANPLAVRPGSGDFILAPGQLIRTGNGNIDIAAGGNICLGCSSAGTVASNGQTAVIYTAGTPSTNAPAFFSNPDLGSAAAAQYPVGGGNIRLAAGNVVSAHTTNLVSNWLWRQGAVDSSGQMTRNSSWWIEFSQFQQGIGALGGGDVTVQAGGDVSNLSVVIPTTGRLGSASATDNTPLAANLVVDGGGNLVVQAGGNVLSGLFEDDLGKAAINAGGGIMAAPGAGSINPVLSLADSSFTLNARTDVVLDGVFNSTALPQAKTNKTATGSNSYFYTYASTSAVNISSAGGDVLLNDNIQSVLAAAKASTFLDSNFSAASTPTYYPPNLQVAALSGDIGLGASNATQLFPAATGNLELLAQDSISLPSLLVMSEVDPAQAHTVLSPSFNVRTFSLGLVSLPLSPLHQGDSEPVRIVAVSGSITGGSGSVTLPKMADFIAGQDIRNLNYFGKNLSPADVSLFEAGGGISYDTTRDPATNQLTSNLAGIHVAGPGYVDVLAGGAIDLGDSNGLVTTGSLSDVRLPGTGATLVVAAGLGRNADGSLRAPAYDAFIQHYLSPASGGSASPYASTVTQYMAQLYPLADASLSDAQALAAFLLLPRQQQLPLLAQVLSAELNATGLAHTRSGANYDRGYQAIATLFPTKDSTGNTLSYAGDINMFFSQIKTEQGGDINLLAPGGAVIVGVPNPPGALNAQKADTTFVPALSAAANLGILVLGPGAVRGFANGDFDVNQSRILTLQGGDIVLWSSLGGIDAGKGAKTAQGAPPPVIETDANGNVIVNPIGAVSGSGIGQLLTVPGVKPGIVDLIAPTGVVNAGDAGIRVAGDLNIAAVAVLNASNIKVGGTATGIPVSDAGALAGALSGAGTLGDSGKTVANQLAQNLSDSAASNQQLAENFRPAFVIVKMFCLGSECDAQ